MAILLSPSDRAEANCSARDAIPAELLALDLIPVQLQALRRQGSVHREQRGKRATIYKLRFRYQGRQHVKYLGTDEAAALRMQAALRQWQAAKQRRRAQRQLLKRASQMLRTSKQTLTPLLEAEGYHYHGQAIRRRRKSVSRKVVSPA